MNNFFLSLDLEEWFNLDYIRRLNFDSRLRVLPEIIPFLDMLDAMNIKITVFVLGELAEQNKNLILDIVNRGHEIALHGWGHELLFDKNMKDFVADISRGRKILEDITGNPVHGFRASCFSMDNIKLDKIRELGFKYDSSYIKFKEHPLYGKLDMSSFKKIDDLIYAKDDFFEFEIPTLDILDRNIPISGGGYFRLLPWWLFKLLFIYFKKNISNFIFYIHPFELSNKKINLPDELKYVQKFRFSVGRKNNLFKLKKFLSFLQTHDYRFLTFKQYVENCDCS